MPRKDWTKHVQGTNIRQCLATPVGVRGEDEVCKGLSKGHLKSLLLAPLQTWTFRGDILSALPAAESSPGYVRHGVSNMASLLYQNLARGREILVASGQWLVVSGVRLASRSPRCSNP